MPSISSELLRLEHMEEENGAFDVRIAHPAVSSRHWMLEAIFRLIYGPFGYAVSECIPRPDFLASGVVFCTDFGYQASSYLALALLWALCSVLGRLKHVNVFPTWGVFGTRPSLSPLICYVHNYRLLISGPPS